MITADFRIRIAGFRMSIKKMQFCENNPKISDTEKKAKHKPSGYAWCSICSFDDPNNRRYFDSRKNCIEKYCKDVKELRTEINNFEEKEKVPLTNKEIKSYEKQKVCHICKKEFCYDKNNEKEFKNKKKIRDHCHYTGKFRGAAHSLSNLRYKVPKEIPIVFHNSSTYDYHFIIKRLAKQFEGEFECLGENTEKNITFSVSLKKENDHGKKITYKLKFIDSYRFVTT